MKYVPLTLCRGESSEASDADEETADSYELLERAKANPNVVGTSSPPRADTGKSLATSPDRLEPSSDAHVSVTSSFLLQHPISSSPRAFD